MRVHAALRVSLLIPATIAAILILVGCDSGGGGLQSLAINPPEVTMQSRGENIQLEAIGKRADGSTVSSDAMDIRWTYSDGSIASVDKSGLLRGVLAGEGTVTAKSETYNMSATIKVHVLSPKFTPDQIQAKLQTVIDGVKAFDVSAATAEDPAMAASTLKDVSRSLSDAFKYIGQGTNNTLASVELLNAANFMDVLMTKTKGSLAEGLAKQSKLARDVRNDLFAY